MIFRFSFELSRIQGNVKEQANYNNDVVSGMKKTFYENGKTKSEASYNNGVLNGYSKEFDEEGNVTFQKEYRDGNIVEK